MSITCNLPSLFMQWKTKTSQVLVERFTVSRLEKRCRWLCAMDIDVRASYPLSRACQWAFEQNIPALVDHLVAQAEPSNSLLQTYVRPWLKAETILNHADRGAAYFKILCHDLLAMHGKLTSEEMQMLISDHPAALRLITRYCYRARIPLDWSQWVLQPPSAFVSALAWVKEAPQQIDRLVALMRASVGSALGFELALAMGLCAPYALSDEIIHCYLPLQQLKLLAISGHARSLADRLQLLTRIEASEAIPYLKLLYGQYVGTRQALHLADDQGYCCCDPAAIPPLLFGEKPLLMGKLRDNRQVYDFLKEYTGEVAMLIHDYHLMQDCA